MFVTYNTGMTVSFVYELGRPIVQKWSSIGTVLALIRAKVDKVFLEGWVNLQQLQNLRPDRISIVNSTVTLQGPVLILPNLQHIKVIMVVLPILLGVLVALGVRTAQLFISNKDEKTKTTTDADENGGLESLKKYVLSATCGLLVAIASFAVARRILPATPGIYFY